MKRRLLILASLVVVLAATAMLLLRRGGSAPSRTTPVILISIDTLRSDRLPVYGYDKVSTPNLDAFRADAILYERAYSHCPLTLPSHASMFTGLLPADHGIRDNIGFTLPEKVPTLPALLKANGYATAAAVSAFVLRKGTGIARGFDAYDDEVEPIDTFQVIARVQRSGGETVAAARKWLDQHDPEKPFFYFLHLYDPHTPYEPPEPFRSQYKANPYDGEIAYTDHVIGEFLDYLKEKGIYDKALIMILADHGEGLNDHREEEHGIFLYREAIQVPLIVKLPGNARAGTSVSATAGLADVFSTILEQTATPRPAGHKDSVSLLSLIDSDAKRNIYSETYYPRMHFGWSDLHSLTDGDHHLIRAPIPELYDLRKDPRETKNVMNEERRTYTAMRNAIEPFV
ncbi:MAG TPA: sulfatase, partial [Thermoanaerobaculia bacterium]|nr:sulfatase [Thermoanaerobaculia bacterium]